MKVIFFGNWNLGYLALKKMLDRNIVISAVVTDYDLDDEDVYKNRVYELACLSQIPVYGRYKDILAVIDEGTIGFSAAYGNEIFKQDILDKIKIYNFHPSYLPYYKGSSAIYWQIKNSEKEWGMSCHEIDTGIDTGEIVHRDKYSVHTEMPFAKAQDEYNIQFSDFIVDCVMEIVEKTDRKIPVETIANDHLKENYQCRLAVPKGMQHCTIKEISDYFNLKRILFFVGNRAELGILFPLILEASNYYYVDVVVYGSYFSNGGKDLEEKKNFIERNHYKVNIREIHSTADGEDTYFYTLPDVYKKVFKYLRKQEDYPYKYAVVLGDRIESFGFALAAFYGQIPLVHVGGGDVADVPYFDTNVRHCLSKMASLHFPVHDEGLNVLRQLGEDEARICNIGDLSYDYGRMNLISPIEKVEEEFGIGQGTCVVFTYHAGPFKSKAENLSEYTVCLKAVVDSKADRIIVTYPNYDYGAEDMIHFLDGMADSERITVVRTLGTPKLHALMSGFQTIIVGNSSAGLLETPFYMCPVLNIGDRQKNRPRGMNVTDVSADHDEITGMLNQIIDHYDEKKKQYEKGRTIFGDGNAAVKAMNVLKKYENTPNKELFTKKFVKRYGGVHESCGDIPAS